MKIITSFAVSLAVIGTCFAIYGIEAEREDKKNDKWVETSAVITQRFIRLNGSTEPYNLLQDVNRTEKDDRLFLPEVRFIYQVDGKEYGGSKLSPIVLPANKEIAKRITDLYRRGMKVKAFYNKENPSDAVLFKRIQKPRHTTIMGFSLIIVSLIILWVSGKFIRGHNEKTDGKTFYSTFFSSIKSKN